MQAWKKDSSNPLERVKIICTKYSDEEEECLNCGRTLNSEFVLSNNEAGYQTCPCGYTNIFETINFYVWVMTLRKTEENKR